MKDGEKKAAQGGKDMDKLEQTKNDTLNYDINKNQQLTTSMPFEKVASKKKANKGGLFCMSKNQTKS